MPIPNDLAALTEIFERLGAEDPAKLAFSQIEESIPQLQRFLITRSVVQHVAPTEDDSWIDFEIDASIKQPIAPFSGLGKALKVCLDAGVSREHLNEIVRCVKMLTIFKTFYILDAPDELPEPIDDVAWGLFEIDENGMPFGVQVSGLYESLLAFDPSKREMRPKKVD